ncbi:MAG: PepSY-like domain-containing protein [Adhaeribacter sp.]
MKPTLILLLAAGSISLGACSKWLPAKEAPALVHNTLMARFPYATEVEWDKKSGLFEAEFNQGQQDQAVLIDETGIIKMIKQDIGLAELPAAVLNKIKKDYPAYQVDDLERVENGASLFYQVELEKGLREKKLVLAPDGAVPATQTYWD